MFFLSSLHGLVLQAEGLSDDFTCYYFVSDICFDIMWYVACRCHTCFGNQILDIVIFHAPLALAGVMTSGHSNLVSHNTYWIWSFKCNVVAGYGLQLGRCFTKSGVATGGINAEVSFYPNGRLWMCFFVLLLCSAVARQGGSRSPSAWLCWQWRWGRGVLFYSLQIRLYRAVGESRRQLVAWNLLQRLLAAQCT